MVRDRRWWLRPRRELANPMGLMLAETGASLVSAQAPETRSHRKHKATSLRVSDTLTYLPCGAIR